MVKHVHRSSCNAAKTIPMFIANFLKWFDVDLQNVITKKVVGHEFLDTIVPPYLQDAKKIKK
jgi:hypothetical protein